MTAAAAEPVHLLLEPHAVFGHFHPVGNAAPATAALLLPPFGWEEIVSYRGRREWGFHLQRDGIPALRVDLPATGDSGGSPWDPGLFDVWVDTVDAAARWLRERTGAERLAAIGIGLGGLLACVAAGRGAPLDDLVLWGTPARGRGLVRELHAFARLEASRLAARGAPSNGAPPEGALAAGGYVMSAETRAALEAVEVETPALEAARATRVLLLGRDGVPADERLQRAFAAAGKTVTTAAGDGFGELVMGDMEAFPPPVGTFAIVSDWLAAEAPPGAPGAGVAPAPAAATEAGLRIDGVEVRERPVRIAAGPSALPGIVTEPAGACAGVSVVLLNAGPQRRTGPNRMWVDIARRWAARGVRSIRFDVSGIGEGDGPSVGASDTPQFYDGRHIDEVRAALDHLAEHGLPGPYVLVGLCSGANWAFHAALQDERVTAAVLLNPGEFFYDRWASQARGGRELRRLVRVAELRRLLAGEVSRRAPLVALRLIGRWSAALPMLLWNRWTGRLQPGRNPLPSAVRTLEANGQRLHILFTEHEHLRTELAASGDLAELAMHPAVNLELVPTGAETHTLQPVWVQAEAHAFVDAAIARELEERS
jgi:alpha-beta hydrolase superfamily lysophospholipase